VTLVPARAADAPIYGIAYYRISGAQEQRDSALSIPTQRSFVTEAMEREGVLFVDERSDILTGKRADRPGYQETLALARKLRMEGRRVAVFVLRLDRFGRDTLERARAWKELRARDISLYSVTGGGWQTDAFLYDLDAALAAREVAIIGDRVRNINAFVRERGFPVAHRVAWGYRLRDATPEERALGSGHKNLEPHPDEAPYVREAFRRRAAGEPLKTIHSWIVGLPSEARGGRAMPAQSVWLTLRAPVYVARHEFPKGHPDAETPVLARPRGRWEPLVDDETWERAQRAPDAHRSLPRQASGNYLLTGILKCGRCGDRVSGSTAAPGRYPRYSCISPTRGANVRSPKACWWSGNAKLLDEAALAYVGRILGPFSDPAVLSVVQAGWERVRREVIGEDDTPRQIAAAEARRTKFINVRDGAYIDWKSGELSAEQYQSVRSRAEAEIALCDRELAALRSRLAPSEVLPPWGEVLAFCRQHLPILEAGTTAERRLVVAQLFTSAVPVKHGYNRYDVEPELTELGHRLLQVAQAVTGDGKLADLHGSSRKRTVN
jgi:DNA invertase Pin-like site-specific DNA recombinase